MPALPLLPVELEALIEQNITDELNQQNTAQRVREVLLYMVASMGMPATPGTPTNPDYAALMQELAKKADKIAVATALAQKEQLFKPFAQSELKAIEYAYSNQALRPLLRLLISAVTTGAGQGSASGGAPQWVPGPQKEGALVYDDGAVYRTRQDITNSQSSPSGNPGFYELIGPTTPGGGGAAPNKQPFQFDATQDGQNVFTLPSGTSGIDYPVQVYIPNPAPATDGRLKGVAPQHAVFDPTALTLTILADASIRAGQTIVGVRLYGTSSAPGGQISFDDITGTADVSQLPVADDAYLDQLVAALKSRLDQLYVQK